MLLKQRISTSKFFVPVSLFLLAFSLILIKFFPFLIGKTLFFGDNYSLMVPGKLFSSQWILEGILPLWNPYIFAGISWIGDINQSLLYPTTLLFAVFNPAVALNVSIVAHLAIAYVSMYLLSRSFSIKPLYAFLAGCLWMFSTQILGSIHNLSTLQALVWLPLMLWSGILVAKYRWGWVVVGVLATVQFAAGYPQHSLYSILSAVLFSVIAEFSFGLHKKNDLHTSFKWFTRWIWAGLLTIGLSAIVWMPFIEAFFESTRMLQTVEQAQIGSLNPMMLIKLLVPTFFDNAVMGMKWGPAWSGQPNVAFYFGWFGLLVLVVNLFRWRKWDVIDKIFAAIVFLTLTFSLGSYLPGYELIQQIIPILQWGRYPSMVMIVTTVVLIVWIARSIETFRLSRKYLHLLLLASILICVSFGVLFLQAKYNQAQLWQTLNFVTANKLASSAFHTEAKDAIIVQSISISVVVSALFFFGCLLALKYKRRELLVLLIVFDVLVSTQWMFIFADKSIYSTKEELSESMPAFWNTLDTRQFRSLTRNGNAPYADFGGYWEALVVREPFSDSFIDSNELQNQHNLKALRDGLTPDWNMVVSQPMIHGYTALLPIDFANTWQHSAEPRINFIDELQTSNTALKDWSTKYYVVDTWYPSYGEVFPSNVVMTSERWTVFELPDTLPRFRYQNNEAVQFWQYSENPNEISFTAESNDGQQQIVVADRYDPNWQVMVNGQDVTLENYQGMRRFAIPEGQISVQMWYEPTAFYRGLMLSSVTLFSLIGYVVFQIIRSRRSSS